MEQRREERKEREREGQGVGRGREILNEQCLIV